MKIGVFQDIHANLPAFHKSIEIFDANQCDKIYHVGDLIGIGPHPREVFEAAMKVENIRFIMGNHDYWFAHGIPSPRPSSMSEEELAHQKWNHEQIGHENRILARDWKFIEEYKIDKNRKICFLHYGYDAESNWFKEYVPHPNSQNMDELFKEVDAEFVFYGHNHEASDIQGKARYINLGSAGCNNKPEVRLGILDIRNGKVDITKITAEYSDNGLMEDFEKRKVPAREFITSHFITRI